MTRPLVGRWGMSRRVPKEVQPSVKRHAAKIGEISFHWNLLQDTFFALFLLVMSDEKPADHNVMNGIWHVIQSDKTQRQMLQAAAEANQKMDKRLRREIIWAINKAEKISQFRNVLIHTPYRFAMHGSGEWFAFPQKLSARKQAIRYLSAVDIDEHWRLVRGDLVALGSYCNGLYTRAKFLGPVGPWPNRPQLQGLRRVLRNLSLRKASQPQNQQRPSRESKARQNRARNKLA